MFGTWILLLQNPVAVVESRFRESKLNPLLAEDGPPRWKTEVAERVWRVGALRVVAWKAAAVRRAVIGNAEAMV